MTSMRISELAGRSGVPLYGERALKRLAFIGAAKRLGIVALLTAWDGGACREVRRDLRPRITARLDEAERRRAEPAAAAEQQRCPFFDFRIHHDGERLRLDVRAAADGAGRLAELFGTAV